MAACLHLHLHFHHVDYVRVISFSLDRGLIMQMISLLPTGLSASVPFRIVKAKKIASLYTRIVCTRLYHMVQNIDTFSKLYIY